jgi:hypothetical protein
MNTISSSLLNDTLQLVQLARETARTQGSDQKAAKLSPVVDNLRQIVTTAMDPKAGPPMDLGILGQDDFRTLMAASTQAPRMQGVQPAPNPEKYQVVSAMASGGMADLDIARHLGMTREEVRMVLSFSQKGE